MFKLISWFSKFLYKVMFVLKFHGSRNFHFNKWKQTDTLYDNNWIDHYVKASDTKKKFMLR